MCLTIFAEIGDFDTSALCANCAYSADVVPEADWKFFISSSGALCMSTSGNSCMYSLVFIKWRRLRR